MALVWWSLLASGLLGTSMSLVCPDGGTCQEGSTCCTDVAGRYGCCPLPRSVRALAVLCPDQHSECPGATTCCQLPDGSWGCCPLAKAVCCDDKRHCCPEGTACDLTRSRCVSAGRDWRGWQPLMSKLPAKPRVSAPAASKLAKVSSVTCPGGESSCPDTFTCCLQAGGDYGCCPYQDAVCCDDGAHCCPNHTVCDLQQGICRPAEGHGRWLPKLPADVDCPNKTWTCPDETTCCQTSPGEYGCCPMPDATCCSDGLHCCPHGTICNLAAATCDDPANGAASVRAISPPNTKCNESMVCPGTSTCCQDVAGDWACCPLKEAVCCHDGFHCCPHGKRCNLEAKTCDDASGVAPPLPWLAKTTAVATGVTACDEHTSCPKGASCCFMKSAGKWGCCPLPQAVCCQDGSHCCPAGHTCDPHRSSCSRGRRVVPWLTKTPAVARPPAVADVKCDDKSSCAAGTTCCKLPTGEWGCCPLVKAVCCPDREHCCPQGYSCNMETGTCEKPAAAPDVAAAAVRVETMVPCDVAAAFACAERETCCRSSASEWACCPSPQAVCCADMKHCCPAHYSCHPSGGCVRTAPTWAASLRDPDIV
ncbi:granulin b isoform X1 [Hippocampus comes]|uniref:granulin b isoform X1 n=1 Tax=Hippocampus comes TaxID=109280 RepID=UPI00094ED94B|nr:PREDICTED: granulins isoform X1 [Hippocampus comes]